MATWEGFEPVTVSIGLDDGLEAQIADPLWLLGRQWQLGEFTGDDSAQPAAARVAWRTLPVESFRPGDGRVEALTNTRPLEEVVEATDDTDLGGGRLFASARAGRRLVRLLRAEGLDAAVATLLAEYRLRPDDHVVSVGDAASRLLARRALDVSGIARAREATLRTKLASAMDAVAVEAAIAVITEWKAWYQARGGRPANQSWDDERLEHRFSLASRGPAGEVAVRAPEHWGGHLDWYTVDMAPEGAGHGLKPVKREPQVTTVVPSPVRYAGMPASRWWEFEDGDVHFGDLDAGPADLARLIVAEFATVYGDDWFVIPVPVPVGSLVEIASLRVVDTFGGDAEIPSTAFNDATRLKSSASRSWRLFELTGDEVDGEHRSPWLFVAPAVAAPLEGPALERVQFARDEGANLAWAIEDLVEGPLGRGLDRPEAWRAAHPPRADGDEAPFGGEPAVYGDEWWKWVLESSAPPWWIPLLPERLDPSSAEVRLRRARMQTWSRFRGSQVGPKSRTLDPRRPRWFYEEEVPRSGAHVEHRWQYARWHDGSIHVWLQRQKRPGRGGATSGLKADLLEPHAGAPTDEPDVAGGDSGAV